MRILVVTHPPLQPEYGAAQMALNLAAALRDRGHDAVAWSTDPLPPGGRPWNTWLRQRRRLATFLKTAPPFDVVDLPAISIGRSAGAHGRLVARSVQPEIRYFGCNLYAEARRLPASLLHFSAGLPTTLLLSAALADGWRRAGVILCLGSNEERWMRRFLPWTRPKLLRYFDAPSPADQARLAAVRAMRASCPGRPEGSGVRFLWIGRWTAHKGIRRLLRFAVRRLAARPADSLTLAGCGEQAARDCPTELLAGGRLRLLPAFARAELPALLAGHDAGLFTSSVEGWGLSLNEMLESGMTVFATPAGGVEDLKPFFPASLRPFPPPLDFVPGPPAEDLAANGYYREISWAGIARRYEEEVLARLAFGRGDAG